MVFGKYLATSLIVALSATSASAATYTFDLQDSFSDHGAGDPGTPVGNVLTLTETGDSGSLTATFTGKYVVNPDYSSDGTLSGVVENAHSVQRHNNGLGVCNVGSCETSEDLYHTVDGVSAPDGRQITDFVEIAFFAGVGDPVDVTLTSLTFGWVGDIYDVYSGTNGMFEILVSDLSDALIGAGASLVFEGTATATPNIIGGLDVEVLPELAAFTDNLFGIKAGIGGSWKLKTATVEYSVPEIPLPAAVWLMLAGIGSIAALRRKRT